MNDLINSELYSTLKDDPIELFKLYDSVLEKLADKHAPSRVFQRRSGWVANWYDGECRGSKRSVRRLERLWRRLKTPEALEDWKAQFEAHRQLLQDKQANYIRQKIAENKGNSKEQWKVLNSILSGSNQDSCCPLSATTFQNFFQKKIEDIRTQTADAAPPTVITQSEFNFDGFQKITVEEALKTLRTVPAKTCELDKIPTWLIKVLADVFAPILAKLVNASISSGIMPEDHKLAIIRPRLKKPNLDPSDPASYRTVSNVSFLSKFVERIANRQLEQYFSNNGLLPAIQSGFRRSHSPETAVLKVYDTVLASDKGEVNVLLLLDYSAAFDTVDHGILLSILEKSFGVTGTALDWIWSFLVGRFQIFQIGPDKSSTVIVFFGLPQGTILGPLFYIVYTADIETIIEKHGVKMHLYADDTQLYDHSRVNNIERSVAALEACLQDIVQWSSWIERTHSESSNNLTAERVSNP